MGFRICGGVTGVVAAIVTDGVVGGVLLIPGVVLIAAGPPVPVVVDPLMPIPSVAGVDEAPVVVVEIPVGAVVAVGVVANDAGSTDVLPPLENRVRR